MLSERIQQTFRSMHWASEACAEQPASPQHAQMFCRLLAGWRGTVGLFTGEQRTGGGNDTRMAGSQRRRLPSAQPIVSDVSGDACIWQTRVHTHTHTRALPFNRGRTHAACPSETEKTLLWVLFPFFIRQNFSDKINK